MKARENYLRALRRQFPEWIPSSVGLSPISWRTHRRDLEELVVAHPRLFPGFRQGQVDFDAQPPVYAEGQYFRDNWGCLWYNIQEGLEGQVVGHPLDDWSALATYRAPDPLLLEERGPRDWARIAAEVAGRKGRDELTTGNGERLFDRLYFLRGFDNLMMDFATEAPELPRLIELLRQYELTLVAQWLRLGVDLVAFHTDIGTQRSLMISPAQFRRYVKPLFRDVFAAVKGGGAQVVLSSDGCLLEIVDDLVECGVDMHDPQLRANSLAGIARAYRGRMCVNLDLDRQMFPFCSPGDIREQVRRVVDTLAQPEGGLMVMAAVYGGDVPLRNIAAICAALEEYCF